MGALPQLHSPSLLGPGPIQQAMATPSTDTIQWPGTEKSEGQRPSMRQVMRRSEETRVLRFLAAFPPKSARWKLLPLAFPLVKAAGFVSDPSLHAQVDF